MQVKTIPQNIREAAEIVAQVIARKRDKLLDNLGTMRLIKAVPKTDSQGEKTWQTTT